LGKSVIPLVEDNKVDEDDVLDYTCEIQTFTYRSPEVIKAENKNIYSVYYDHRIDIWSLGMILLEWANGYNLMENLDPDENSGDDVLEYMYQCIPEKINEYSDDPKNKFK